MNLPWIRCWVGICGLFAVDRGFVSIGHWHVFCHQPARILIEIGNFSWSRSAKSNLQKSNLHWIITCWTFDHQCSSKLIPIIGWWVCLTIVYPQILMVYHIPSSLLTITGVYGIPYFYILFDTPKSIRSFKLIHWLSSLVIKSHQKNTWIKSLWSMVKSHLD